MSAPTATQPAMRQTLTAAGAADDITRTRRDGIDARCDRQGACL